MISSGCFSVFNHLQLRKSVSDAKAFMAIKLTYKFLIVNPYSTHENRKKGHANAFWTLYFKLSIFLNEKIWSKVVLDGKKTCHSFSV